MHRAKISSIAIGSNLSIEGLELEDGSFAIAVSQIATLFLVPQKNSSRAFKAILGEDFQFLTSATTLNSKKVNIVSLAQFETLAFELAFAGNEHAKVLMKALIGLSLSELFKDAFGQTSDAESREAYLDSRIASLASPWAKLVEQSTCDRIREFFGTHCGESFWWTYIYKFLTAEERCKLDRLNPVSPGTKQRATRIHQWIVTEDGIRERLSKKVLEVVVVLRSSTSKQDFRTRMSRLDGLDQKALF